MPIPYLTPFTSYPQFHTYYSYFSTISSSTMGAEIGIFSLNQIQKLAQSQQNHQSSNTNNSTTAGATGAPSWMWNPKNQSTHHQEQEDDSWEVRAFAEDTGNIMGTTWPPRSYTCTFCRREFRSAQALGGHMNVHRRDRARLHQSHPPNTASSPPQLPNPNNPTFIIPAQELIAASPHLNGQPAGLCLLYQLPNNPTTTINYNNNARRGNDHHHSSSPSTLLSFSPFTQTSIINNLMPTQSLNFPLGRRMLNSANSPVNNLENVKNCTTVKEVRDIIAGEEEEVDLELRLGHRSTMTSSSSSSN